VLFIFGQTALSFETVSEKSGRIIRFLQSVNDPVSVPMMNPRRLAFPHKTHHLTVLSTASAGALASGRIPDGERQRARMCLFFSFRISSGHYIFMCVGQKTRPSCIFRPGLFSYPLSRYLVGYKNISLSGRTIGLLWIAFPEVQANI